MNYLNLYRSYYLSLKKVCPLCNWQKSCSMPCSGNNFGLLHLTKNSVFAISWFIPFFLCMCVCMFVWHVNRLNLALSIIIWHRDPVELINGTCVSAIVSGGYSAMNWMGPLIFRYRALKIWPNRPINKENFNRTQINQWSLGIVTFHTRTMLMQNSMLQIYIPLLTYEYPISYHNTLQMCCLDTTIQ